MIILINLNAIITVQFYIFTNLPYRMRSPWSRSESPQRLTLEIKGRRNGYPPKKQLSLYVLIIIIVSVVTVALRVIMWNTDTSHYLIRYFRKVIVIIFACDIIAYLLTMFLLSIIKDNTKAIWEIASSNIQTRLI